MMHRLDDYLVSVETLVVRVGQIEAWARAMQDWHETMTVAVNQCLRSERMQNGVGGQIAGLQTELSQVRRVLRQHGIRVRRARRRKEENKEDGNE